MLKQDQAERLKAAGLDFYNHNLDTSEDFYPEIISTRHFADRLKTIQAVHDAQLNSCVGGIIGLGESVEQRAHLIADRKSTRLNSSHVAISYAVFCLKKKINL